jgi:hypothetical protein
MSSVTFICNLALSNIGKGTINDIDEASAEANVCNLHYEKVRDIALQGFSWSWAMKAQTLPQLANDWTERFQFAYRRPQDCLKILRLVPDVDVRNDRVLLDYAVRGALIYCDQPTAMLEYIARIDDPTKYPPLFQEALGWALAAKIALPLTKDQSIRKDAYQIAAQAMNAAQTADANEEAVFWNVRSELIEARN